MTYLIILMTVIISVAAFYNKNLMGKLIFSPYLVKNKKEYFRFLSSGFLHANWAHLIINMLVLYSFGMAVEKYYKDIFGITGNLYFIGLYLGAIIVSDIPTYLKHKNSSHYLSLGASGAVSAVLFTSILFNPLGKIYIWGMLPVPGIILGVLYLIYSAQMAKRSQDNINHGAHFYGALYGIVYTLVFEPKVFLHFINQLISWL